MNAAATLTSVRLKLATLLAVVAEYRSPESNPPMPPDYHEMGVRQRLAEERGIANPSHLRIRWEMLKDDVHAWWPLFALRAAICEIKGHDIVMDGYAGPDSGAEWADCQRCGKGWFHQYY